MVNYTVNKARVALCVPDYLDSIQNNCEMECILGRKDKYRFTDRDSFDQHHTDCIVLYKYCLYPIYIKGDKALPSRIKQYVKQMSLSSDPIALYQVAKMIIDQDYLISGYEGLPFVIDFKDIIRDYMDVVEREKSRLGSNYEIIQRISKSNRTFKSVLGDGE